MTIKPLVKFEKDDVEKLRQFFAVFTSANYNIKGDGVECAGALITWYRGLEEKINGALKKQMLDELDEGKPTVSPIDKSENKKGKK